MGFVIAALFEGCFFGLEFRIGRRCIGGYLSQWGGEVHSFLGYFSF